MAQTTHTEFAHDPVARAQPRRPRFGWAAVTVGTIGLVAAVVPLAIWSEPPIWWRWVDPDAGGGSKVSIGSVTFEWGAGGDNRGDEEAANRSAIRICRIAAMSAGLLGLVLGIIGWVREPAKGIAKTGAVVSLLALTWDFVVLGAGLAVVIVFLGSLS